jgi:hypothetical protein
MFLSAAFFQKKAANNFFKILCRSDSHCCKFAVIVSSPLSQQALFSEYYLNGM